MKIRAFIFSLLYTCCLFSQADTVIIYEEAELDRKVSEICGNIAYVQQFVNREIHYPDAAKKQRVEGLVVFSFILDEKGKKTDFRILQDPGSGCGEIVLKKMPLFDFWYWPRHEGKNVKARLVRYLHFRLTDTSITYSIRHPDMNGPFVSPSEWERENKIYEQFDLSKPASFPGGERALLQFLQKEINWSVCSKDSLNLSTKAIVSFVVDKDGNIWDVRILKSPHPCLNEPILAAIRRMPRWHHAEANGCPVLMRNTIPIRIRWE